MCGIAGVMVFEDGPFTVTPSYLERMRDTMVHRGPDGAGSWIDDRRRVGLAHRRLSIIDLSAAASQPMANEDGTLHVVFNGEIYNHAEIRAELESLGGHAWRTDHSDTEVILHAYETWGHGCLERFRGMFAFALWDSREQALWLVRDRVGIKPLYYALHHNRLVFASEIKALLSDPEQPRRVDEAALHHFLSFLTTPAPGTLFHGIRKLPAGSWLRISRDGTMRETRYWDPLERAQPLTGLTEQAVAERVLEGLREAVALRKVSDVPVGVFLSGGVDSSANTALFSEGEGEAVRTFSIGYGGESHTQPSELAYARRMAATVGARHFEHILTIDDLIRFLPRMVALQDEPIADPVCVPVYYVSKLARDNGVTVCQVGEGADELFGGYPGWLSHLRLEAWNALPAPRASKRLLARVLTASGLGPPRIREYLRRAGHGEALFWSSADTFSEEEKRALLSPRLRREQAGLSSWDAIKPLYDRYRAHAWEDAPLNWMSYVDLSFRLPELLLMRVDKMSMGVSLEGRVPFLDHKFVELAMSVPAAMKVRNGRTKHLLKEALRPVVPAELVDRRKQGFGVPVHEWFEMRLGKVMRAEVRRFARTTDLLDPAGVEVVLQGRDRQRVWYLFNLALWWRHYIAGEALTDLTELER